MLLETAGRFPESTAWEKGGEKYTYRELFGRAASIASTLEKAFPGRNSLVPVVADKSIGCYAAILAAVVTGKAYLPLNPGFPAARNTEILHFTGSTLFVAGKKDKGHSKELENAGFQAVAAEGGEAGALEHHTGDAKRTVYLLFTSGSTGRPKGVPVAEENLLAYLENIKSYVKVGPGDRCSQVFDLTFDLSVHDLFVTWTSGACLVVPEQESPLFFHRYIREKQITSWFTVPSTIQLMDRMRLLKPGIFPSLKHSLFCGEALPVALAEKWAGAAPGSAAVNLYGPTETTIAVAGYTLPPKGEIKSKNGIVTIGNLFPGHNGRLGHKDEMKGELLISGKQVVDGYCKNEEQTNSSFIVIEGRKYYRTGDIAESDAGLLYFMGRSDQEVKLHGYRINLLEIDHVMNTFLGGKKAVNLFDRAGRSGRIVTFAANVEDPGKVEKQLLEHCRDTLPWYMVPEKVIFVDEFPLNVNGKIDRKKLEELLDENGGNKK